MIVEHGGARPRIAASAYVAPTAVVCGDVTVGERCRILFGAVLTAEGGPVTLGDDVIVMENAVVRGRPGHACAVGDNVLIGPHAHVNGASLGTAAFVATGASIFAGASVGEGAEVRIGGVVHVNTLLPDGAIVPIGWVAVGNPATVLPPGRHDDIAAIQQGLDFVGTMYGVDRSEPAEEVRHITTHYVELLGRHRGDVVIGSSDVPAD